MAARHGGMAGGDGQSYANLMRCPQPRSRFATRRPPNRLPSELTKKAWGMQDLLWIGVMAGLLAATLAYATLCDHA